MWHNRENLKVEKEFCKGWIRQFCVIITVLSSTHRKFCGLIVLRLDIATLLIFHYWHLLYLGAGQTTTEITISEVLGRDEKLIKVCTS